MRFILVHGGFHGAWCWERVVPELAALGHEAIALDLPGHGERASERPADYRGRVQPILDALQGGDVLVGHSGGGYDNAVAANLAPDKVGHMIFLAAGLPVEGKSVVEATGGAAEADDTGKLRATKLMDDSTGMLRFIRPLNDGTMAWTSREGARILLPRLRRGDSGLGLFEAFARHFTLPQRAAALARAVGRAAAAQLHPVPAGPIQAAVDERGSDPPSRRRAADHRLLALPLSQPPARTGGAVRPGSGDQAGRAVAAGIGVPQNVRSSFTVTEEISQRPASLR